MAELKTTERTRVKRIPDRGRHDRQTVNAILDAALIAHVAFEKEGEPAVLPTAHWRQDDTLYVHGHSKNAMLHAAKDNAISVCVTLLDGLVLARSGFHHSINYRSVVIFGTAREVSDPAEKMEALKVFTDKIAPGRWDEIREPTTQELKATMVLAIPIEEASAKVRTGPPVDDEEDYALPVWAGVVPISQVAGTAVPDDRLADGTPLPDYLDHFNRMGR
ncbi:MAG: pyridoxamine 5'-phosphate oxidase family protein [Alphaproteobacteria bacterium]|jgi:nitroimidazol reductase NimA-like FMN-containing flavoprotein (pyridoxamine 5'-phosphate oxidase superfamily)